MPTLTEAQWKRLEPFLKNMKPQRRAVAYRRLVQGMSLLEAGQPQGYRTSEVALITRAVLKWHAKLSSAPERSAPPAGWLNVEFCVPAHRVDDVRRVVQALCPAQPAAPTAASSKAQRSRSHAGGRLAPQASTPGSPEAALPERLKRK